MKIQFNRRARTVDPKILADLDRGCSKLGHHSVVSCYDFISEAVLEGLSIQRLQRGDPAGSRVQMESVVRGRCKCIRQFTVDS